MGLKPLGRLAFLLAVVLTAYLTPLPAQAQGGGIQVLDETYSYTFAQQAIFEIEIEGSLVEANLIYTVEGEIGQKFQRAEIVGGRARAEVSLTSGQIPPASEVSYFWRIGDSRGQVLRTQEQSFRYLDQRFSWKSETRDDVTVFWYGRDQFGDQLLSQTERSLAVIEDRLGISQSQPVRIVVYQNWNDMRPAVVERWGENQVVSLGVAMNAQTAVLFLHGSWERTLTHELTHVLTSQFTEGPYSRLPFWLSEGLATYTEGGVRNGTQNPLSIGLLSSGPTRKEDIDPAYAQAQSLVTFLIREHGGSANIRSLLATIAQGVTIDDALNAVYGFDRQGLERQWREWIGEPTEEVPPSAPDRPQLLTLVGISGLILLLSLVMLVVLLVTLFKKPAS